MDLPGCSEALFSHINWSSLLQVQYSSWSPVVHRTDGCTVPCSWPWLAEEEQRFKHHPHQYQRTTDPMADGLLAASKCWRFFFFFFVVSGSWQRGTLPPQMLWKHIFLDFQDSWKFWKRLTWSLVPPGTNSWLANWATAVMAGRRSPQAEARMSLTVTLVALSVTMLWALLQRYSSSAGDTTSSSSFLRTAVSFLLTRAQETPLWSLYCLVWLLPESGHELCCCVLPVRVSISLLQHLDDLWQQMSRISGAQKIQQNFFAVLVIDDLIQRWQDLLKARHDSLRFSALTAWN